MKVVSLYPPALLVLSGKKYIVPMWQQVPMETELSDIDWSRPESKQLEVDPIIKQGFVTGSTGNEYFVKLHKSGKAECECWGYRRHKKDCKHIKGFRNEKL